MYQIGTDTCTYMYISMEEGNQQGMAAVAAKIISGGEEFEVPCELLEDVS